MKKIFIFLGGFSGLFFTSCNTDNDDNYIKSGILGTPNYDIHVDVVDDNRLEINNIKLEAVQTNALSSYQLGKLSQGDFGETNISIVSQVNLPTPNPTFGVFNQTTEGSTKGHNEEEKVEKVYLYLPFYVTGKQSYNSKNEIVTTYKVDSVFGNSASKFKLKVDELNYYLSDIDTELNSKVYLSNQATPLGVNLANVSDIQISNEAIVRHAFDDPTTTENESTKERDKLTPGIRVELNKDFFQTHFLDKEGAAELANNIAFSNYFKGIVISAYEFSDDILTLIDLSKARIEVEYSYLTKDKDKKDIRRKSSVELSLYSQGRGIAFNKYDVKNQNIDISTNDNIYLKGGEGYIAEIMISKEYIQSLKDKKALINEADIYFYVNQEKIIDKNKKNQPMYLLVYNAQTGEFLPDYANDLSLRIITSIQKLQKDANGNFYYKVRINDFLTELIKGKENVKLGIAVSLNNNRESMIGNKYKGNDSKLKNTVKGNSENSLYTVIHGKNNADKNKRLQLRVTYSTPKK